MIGKFIKRIFVAALLAFGVTVIPAVSMAQDIGGNYQIYGGGNRSAFSHVAGRDVWWGGKTTPDGIVDYYCDFATYSQGTFFKSDLIKESITFYIDHVTSVAVGRYAGVEFKGTVRASVNSTNALGGFGFGETTFMLYKVNETKPFKTIKFSNNHYDVVMISNPTP